MFVYTKFYLIFVSAVHIFQPIMTIFDLVNNL